jgi:hypothetical protein
MPLTIWEFAAAFLLLVVISKVIVSRRRKARAEETRTFAALHGFVSEGNRNPFAGVEVHRPQRAPGIGAAPVEPQTLIDLAAGRGTVENVMRGSTDAGEVIVLDYRPPSPGASTGHPVFATLAAFRVAGLPEFLLVRRFGFAIGLKTIDFPSYPRFTKRFRLMANDEDAVRKLFSAEVVAACEATSQKESQFQAGSGWLLSTFGRTDAKQLPQLVHESARVAAAFQSTMREG